MLDNILSFYFIKKLFSNVNEKIKLGVAKYNKSLQNKINISLINYKVFSEAYIIYETNGNAKKYDGYNNMLLFEGGYLNGKGKEYNYYNGKLIFEGECLNGLRNGKGKEYNCNGKLIFEGEYLNI